ncbi:hypothetical protein [Gracilimonas mengyeensis]|uniref:Outer membrane protein beta-barrel domain-containing protein n=1 Tax=Gracilimonas mengyeensis TaxID=1302730 RepID=A0A521FCA9_9BACT|nr:hypothetical protein [Gracilimonas mengyeensis]SMO93832.1 hypothetical protein SAMN06265219_11711 [Gracilimonas mengyeensis]
MKDKDQHKELTDHIRETLLEHEEPYVLGSWERFQKHAQHKDAASRRKMIYAAAASLLLLVSAAVAWSTWPTVPEQQLASNETITSPQVQPPADSQQENVPVPTQEENNIAAGEEVIPSSSLSPTQNSRETLATTSAPPSNDTQPGPDRMMPLIYDIQIETVSEGLASLPAASAQQRQSGPSKDLSERSSMTMDSLMFTANPTSLPVITELSPSKKLTFSAGYASVVNVHDTQADLGMGGGFYTDWNFSKRISISSGLFIAQNQLKYEQIPNGAKISVSSAESGFSVASPSSPYLAYMQLDLINLEIPLNLKLQVSEHFTVSAGISSLTYLKENYNYVYEFQKNVQVNDRNIANDVEPVTQTITLQTSQTQSESTLKRMDWAAFYTFSLGYERPFVGDTYATLEPFVKIPAGQITSLGVRYTTGGLQLKISF